MEKIKQTSHLKSFSEIPFSTIEKLGDKTLLYSNTFRVDWVLGAFCNYQCSYCWPEVHSSKPDYRPLQTLIKTTNEIKKQARERGYNSFIFAFSGGEPSLSKGFLDLIRHISDDSSNCETQTVHMTTNLSPGFKWLKKWIELTAPLQSKHIIASFHSEFAKKEIFVEKIQFLQEHGIPVSINLVMTPKHFETSWEDALYFNSNNININLIPQRSGQELVSGWTDSMKQKLKEGFPNKKNLHITNNKNKIQELVSGWTNSMKQKLKEGFPNKKNLHITNNKNKIQELVSGWTNSMKQKLKEGFPNKKNLHITNNKNKIQQAKENDSRTSTHCDMELTDSNGKIYFLDRAERLNILNFNKFKGWECLAGYRSLIIDRNGYVKRGHSCHTDETLGHIETNFQLFPKVETCITKTPCHCGADLMIPKRKKGSSLPL